MNIKKETYGIFKNEGKKIK